MNKIRIIDLLNKIANGTAPKKIKTNAGVLERNGNQYKFEGSSCRLCFDYYIEKNKLDEEVEIIEEEEKEIEKLNYKVEQLDKPSHNESLLMNMIRENKETINKLIDELRKEK